MCKVAEPVPEDGETASHVGGAETVHWGDCRASVISALKDSLNVLSISQALTWLAGDRTEFQEQLDWKSQVYRMVAVLTAEERE